MDLEVIKQIEHAKQETQALQAKRAAAVSAAVNDFTTQASEEFKQHFASAGFTVAGGPDITASYGTTQITLSLQAGQPIGAYALFRLGSTIFGKEPMTVAVVYDGVRHQGSTTFHVGQQSPLQIAQQSLADAQQAAAAPLPKFKIVALKAKERPSPQTPSYPTMSALLSKIFPSGN